MALFRTWLRQRGPFLPVLALLLFTGLVMALVLGPSERTGDDAQEPPRIGSLPPPPAPTQPAETVPVRPRLPQAAPSVPQSEGMPASPPGPDLGGEEGAPPPTTAADPGPPPAASPDPRTAPTAGWRSFAVPAPAGEARARVVIVIDDMGLDRKRSARIAALPGPLTLAFLPYGRDVAGQARQAREKGHELLVHMPMEPEGRADPGPDALLSRLSPAEIRTRLARNLSAMDGYVGINNHMGSRFTADPAGMGLVMEELAARGLLFLDSRTTAQTTAPDLAPRFGVPLLSRDVFLDDTATAAAVAAALAKVEEIALTSGIAIAIGHPYDVTAEALERWLPTLEAKGIKLIPLSAALPQEP